MNRKKIIHIHSDPKFIYEHKIYDSNNFENTVYFWSNKSISTVNLERNINHISYNQEGLEKLISLCNKADIVVINGLMGMKIDLCLALAPNVKILWRFFGGEIYSKEPKLIYSQKSLQTWKSAYQKLSFSNQLKHIIWHVINRKDKFRKAIKRIDYFLGLMDDEYNLLNSLGYNLPKFIQIPFSSVKINDLSFNKQNIIIFGNSKNRPNNHLDILEIFEKNKLPKNLQIRMFFNYGEDGEYSEQVKSKAEAIKQIVIVKEFLSREEFQNTYRQAKALIFNGYRQMAMGNIFTALQLGVKVYLSERNVAYTWLLKNNFKVFTIEKDLITDLNNENYFLSNQDINHNLNQFKQLIQTYNLESFHKSLSNL